MTQKASISFTLALDAGNEEVSKTIAAINDFFGGTTASAVASGSGAATPTTTAAQPTIVGDMPAAESLPPAPDFGDLDKDGLPWDERIHSSSKAKNADGTWRAKRGVDEKTMNNVKASLQSTVRPMVDVPDRIDTVAKFAAWSASGKPKLGEKMLCPSLFEPKAAPTPPPAAAPTPPAPALPVPGLPTPPLPGANVTNQAYTDLVTFLTEHTQSPSNPTGRLTQDWIKGALVHYGVEDGSLTSLAHRPDLVKTVHDGIRTALGL